MVSDELFLLPPGDSVRHKRSVEIASHTLWKRHFPVSILDEVMGESVSLLSLPSLFLAMSLMFLSCYLSQIFLAISPNSIFTVSPKSLPCYLSRVPFSPKIIPCCLSKYSFLCLFKIFF